MRYRLQYLLRENKTFVEIDCDGPYEKIENEIDRILEGRTIRAHVVQIHRTIQSLKQRTKAANQQPQ